jgi:heme/copper-type cytochrome/quinol oxidase subunit 3
MSSIVTSPPAAAETALPVLAAEHRTLGWWGMMATLATEAALFAYLLFSYYYLASQASGPWPPDGVPALRLALPNTLVLIASSVCVWWAERAIRRSNRAGATLGLAAGLVLGLVFVIVQLMEWRSKPFTVASHAYGSLYFTVTGFHVAHVAGGLIILAALLIWSALRYFHAERHAPISVGAVYWHFVDVVWLTVFATFYLTPRLT